MTNSRNLFTSGLRRVRHNKRYIIWFYVLNLFLAVLGVGTFANQAHGILDHSLHAGLLLHGLSLGALVELFMRPEFGPAEAATASALHFAVAFFLLTALFMPGVFEGYASTYRLPRDEFFRACGRNLWRFIRLMLVAAIIFIAIGAGLFALEEALVKTAVDSTNELLPFEVRVVSLVIIFLIMAALRIWFDLAEADVVLSDQRAVRRSIGKGFRHAWRHLARLLVSYVATTIIAAIILIVGLFVWIKFVPPASVTGAFLVSQFTLLLLLIPRFWQRGVAVSYYMQHMVEPIPVQSFTPAPIPTSAPTESPLAPSGPSAPPEPQAT
jgi:hypothetical protein